MRLRLERSISFTVPSELQAMPVNLHIEEFEFHELNNALVLEFWKAVLMFRRIWSSSELAVQNRERRERRERK